MCSKACRRPSQKPAGGAGNGSRKQEKPIDSAELTSSEQVSQNAAGGGAGQEVHEKSALNCLTLLLGHPKEEENGNENGNGNGDHNSCDTRLGPRGNCLRKAKKGNGECIKK